jgi:type IV pilus assembly protein PilM
VAFGFKMPGRIKMPGWLRGGSAVRKPSWSWLAPKYPLVAFDLDTRMLAMTRVGRRKQESFLASFEVEEVPPDLIEIDFMKARLTSPERYRAIVGRLIAKEPLKTKSASIVIPDNYARVSILPFETMPGNRRDTLDLIRYKTKKSVPFKVEEAALDYQMIRGAEGQVSVIAVLIPKSVIDEFEGVFGSHGVHIGLVDLSTFSLVNAYQPVLAREMDAAAEYLVANVSGTYFSFAIFRGESLLFFRCKSFAMGTGDDSDEGSIRLLKRELQTSLLYYRDKLEGKDLSRAYLRVVDLDRAAVSDLFSAEQGIASVAMMDLSRVLNVQGRVSGEHGERTMQRLLPAIGATAGRGSR